MDTELVIQVDEKVLAPKLHALRDLAQSIVVKDAQTCLDAKAAQLATRNYMKDVKSKLEPFVNAAKTNLQIAKTELAKWIDPAEAVDTLLAQKVKDYEREERAKAEAQTRRENEERERVAREKARIEREEQERIVKEQRAARVKEINLLAKRGEIGKREQAKLLKEAGALAEAAKEQALAEEEEAKIRAANAPKVVVQPNIPKVAGVPSRQNYKFRVVNPLLIPDDYWTIDESAIGIQVRADRDKAKTEKRIPGIEVYVD